MSIALAMVSKYAAVIASDSKRVESNGDITLDYDKTFSIGDWLIGANVGLLEFAGLTLAGHVKKLFPDKKPLKASECAGRLSAYLLEVLSDEVKEGEVAFCHRRLDILMVGRSGLAVDRAVQTLRIEPNVATSKLETCQRDFSPWAIAGDEDAKAFLKKELESIETTIPNLHSFQVISKATDLIVKAIAASGKHPNWPNITACGGTPKTVCLR